MPAKKDTKRGLTVQGLSCSMGGNTILKEIDLSLAEGQTCLVIGPSGSGKTTLLSIMAGLQKPNQGQVIFDGVVLSNISFFYGLSVLLLQAKRKRP